MVSNAPQIMTFRNRHFLKLLDFAPAEIECLLDTALTLKRLRAARHEQETLTGRKVGLLFHQSRPEVRWTSELALAAQGASLHYYGPGESALQGDDSQTCSGKLLGRLFDGIAVFGLAQEKLEELARHAGCAVCNLGNSTFQPVGVLADLLTVKEVSSRPFHELSFTFLGDGRSPIAQSMMVAVSKLGIDFRFCGPKDMQPEETLVETCNALSSETGGQLRLFTDPKEAVQGADFISSHSWYSEDKKSWEKRVKKLFPYRVTQDLLAESGNARCFLLHRLPAVLDEDSEYGARCRKMFEVDGLEVSRDLFDSISNLSFDQAENQLHCCKAVMVSLLA